MNPLQLWFPSHDRSGDEKTYNYLERAIKELKGSMPNVDEMKGKIKTLTDEKIRLEALIAEGSKDIEELAEHRLEICKNCIWYSENVKNKEYTELSNCITDIKSIDYIEDTKKREDIHCVNCSCNLGLKTRCLSCVCPTGRWGAVTNIAGEEQAILQIVAENESN